MRVIYVLKRIFNISLKSCDIKSNFEKKSTKNFRTIKKYDVNNIYRIILKCILYDN